VKELEHILMKRIIDELKNDYFNTKKKRWLAWGFLEAFFVYLFVCYFPFVMEYYVVRPQEGFLSYLLSQYSTADTYTYYEMVVCLFAVVLLTALSKRLISLSGWYR